MFPMRWALPKDWRRTAPLAAAAPPPPTWPPRPRQPMWLFAAKGGSMHSRARLCAYARIGRVMRAHAYAWRGGLGARNGAGAGS
jgi:hypothetical protein